MDLSGSNTGSDNRLRGNGERSSKDPYYKRAAQQLRRTLEMAGLRKGRKVLPDGTLVEATYSGYGKNWTLTWAGIVSEEATNCFSVLTKPGFRFDYVPPGTPELASTSVTTYDDVQHLSPDFPSNTITLDEDYYVDKSHLDQALNEVNTADAGICPGRYNADWLSTDGSKRVLFLSSAPSRSGLDSKVAGGVYMIQDLRGTVIEGQRQGSLVIKGLLASVGLITTNTSEYVVSTWYPAEQSREITIQVQGPTAQTSITIEFPEAIRNMPLFLNSEFPEHSITPIIQSIPHISPAGDKVAFCTTSGHVLEVTLAITEGNGTFTLEVTSTWLSIGNAESFNFAEKVASTGGVTSVSYPDAGIPPGIVWSGVAENTPCEHPLTPGSTRNVVYAHLPRTVDRAPDNLDIPTPYASALESLVIHVEYSKTGILRWLEVDLSHKNGVHLSAPEVVPNFTAVDDDPVICYMRAKEGIQLLGEVPWGHYALQLPAGDTGNIPGRPLSNIDGTYKRSSWVYDMCLRVDLRCNTWLFSRESPVVEGGVMTANEDGELTWSASVADHGMVVGMIHGVEQHMVPPLDRGTASSITEPLDADSWAYVYGELVGVNTVYAQQIPGRVANYNNAARYSYSLYRPKSWSPEEDPCRPADYNSGPFYGTFVKFYDPVVNTGEFLCENTFGIPAGDENGPAQVGTKTFTHVWNRDLWHCSNLGYPEEPEQIPGTVTEVYQLNVEQAHPDSSPTGSHVKEIEHEATGYITRALSISYYGSRQRSWDRGDTKIVSDCFGTVLVAYHTDDAYRPIPSRGDGSIIKIQKYSQGTTGGVLIPTKYCRDTTIGLI